MHGAERMRHKLGHRDQQEIGVGSTEHDFRVRRFPEICWVLQIGAMWPNRETNNFVPKRHDSFYFPSYEGMADGRVDVAKIGHAHDCGLSKRAS